VAVPGIARLIGADIVSVPDPGDAGYFRTSREARFGMPLEQVQAKRDEAVKGFRPALHPLHMSRRAQPFLAGTAPLHADAIVFGCFQWARCTSPFRLLEADDPVEAWRLRILDLPAGIARRVPSSAIEARPRRSPAMRAALPAALAALIALSAMTQPQAPYTLRPHNIALPPDWDTLFIRYATVDKADRKIIRQLYVNPEAYAATRPGAPAPHGTLLIMADTHARLDAQGNPLRDAAGRFIPEPGWIAIAAQQKQAGWGEGYGPEMRNGAWEYAAFDGRGQRRDIRLNACFGCHFGARAEQDFNFTLWDHVQGRR
jgi:hypothetical protein